MGKITASIAAWPVSGPCHRVVFNTPELGIMGSAFAATDKVTAARTAVPKFLINLFIASIVNLNLVWESLSGSTVNANIRASNLKSNVFNGLATLRISVASYSGME